MSSELQLFYCFHSVKQSTILTEISLQLFELSETQRNKIINRQRDSIVPSSLSNKMKHNTKILTSNTSPK